MNDAPPRAAYVHVPFCNHRCGYCNFAVVANRLDLADDFLRSIDRELAQLGHSHVVDTLYVGGGTPTELEPTHLSRLLALLDRWLPRSGDYEFTAEANPETFNRERADMLLAAGVNRISIGVQSFDDTKLARLDRRHSAAASRKALALALEMFGNVSIDLIFAAPDEALPDWQSDVDTAIEQGITHISTYGLTYERGTSFWSQANQRKLAEVDEDVQRSMYEWSIDHLTANGFEHYEVSNYARPGKRSRHNETYWMGKSYYAFGPGASRYVNGLRQTNHRSTTTYLKRMLSGESPVFESDTVSDLDRAKERLVFGLRRLEGIREAQFAHEFGLTVQEVAGSAIGKFVALGMLERENGFVRLTRAGLLVSDGMWPDFL